MPIHYSSNTQKRSASKRLKAQLLYSIRHNPVMRVALHVAFVTLAFSAAVAGGYLISTPAEGIQLTTGNLAELPLAVAVVNSAVFLLVWSWAVVKGLAWLSNASPQKTKMNLTLTRPL